MTEESTTVVQESGVESLTRPAPSGAGDGQHVASLFRGRGHHAIDDKGRLTLPTQMRKALRDGGNLAVLDGRVAIWDEPTYRAAVDRLNALADELELTPADVRSFTSNTHAVSPDAQGRIVIPHSVRIDAGLSRDVVVLGAGPRIEILPAGDEALDDPAVVTDAVVDALTRGHF